MILRQYLDLLSPFRDYVWQSIRKLLDHDWLELNRSSTNIIN